MKSVILIKDTSIKYSYIITKLFFILIYNKNNFFILRTYLFEEYKGIKKKSSIKIFFNLRTTARSLC